MAAMLYGVTTSFEYTQCTDLSTKDSAKYDKPFWKQSQNWISKMAILTSISEYDQEIPQSQTADQPMAP